eukprot:3824190-Lingulodinium_polyedra.AAC.1
MHTAISKGRCRGVRVAAAPNGARHGTKHAATSGLDRAARPWRGAPPRRWFVAGWRRWFVASGRLFEGGDRGEAQ